MERVARMSAALVGMVALTVLVGWYSGAEMLTTVVPGYTSMKPNAALCLLALAAAVTARDSPRWVLGLGVLTAALGAATVLEYVLGRSFGIDTILPGLELGESARMALATATAITLLGGAAIASARGRATLMRTLAMLAFGVGYVALLGYLYGVSSLYKAGGYTSMAVHTAAAVVVLALALLLLDPDAGLLGLARDQGSAGQLLRPMVPFLLLGPPALGWVRLWAQNQGWFDTAFGVAVLVMSMTAIGGALTWRASVQVRAMDRQREQAAAELLESNSTLEIRVEERTDALRSASERLSSLIKVAPVGIIETDAEGGVLSVNPGWEALSGLTEQETLGAGWGAAVHPDDVERVRAEWGASIAAAGGYDTTFRMVSTSGRINWVHVITTPLRDEDNNVSGHLAAVADVTALVAAQDAATAASHAAMAAQARFQAAFASSPLGIALVSMDGVVQEVNRRFGELMGLTSEVLEGKSVESLFEAQELPEQEPWLEALMDATIASHRMERQVRTGEGAPTWVEVTIAVIWEGALAHGLLYELADVTARRLAEKRAEHMALHDPLTDLPNRLLLLDRLRQSLLEAARHSRGVGVLFIDLDRFKIVNDTLGHHAGDEVLIQVAARLQRTARASDTVARLGGDEFVVVCPDIGNARDVLEIANHLREAVAKPFSLGDETVSIDASIGIAFGVGHDDPESLLKDADQAMYQAKDHGRARYEVFDSDLRGRIERRLDIELGLRAAVERGEIESWYQPIVDLQNPGVVAHEALARWRRPRAGIVLPDIFIPVAEETGLIRDIGMTVLTQACLAAAAVPNGRAVSVNVSARQFTGHDFGAVVGQALSSSGLPPHRLWLELTESSVVQAIDSAGRMFQGLRDQGIRIAIDDFGTGFSSFEHLRSFRVDILKIDMRFVHQLAESEHDRVIVEGILRLADSLHLDVVAEGIETASQRDLLSTLGCRFGQGYLFGRPERLAALPP